LLDFSIYMYKVISLLVNPSCAELFYEVIYPRGKMFRGTGK